MTEDRTMSRVYLVDDEPLALKRLSRLLRATAKVEIAGSTTEPKEALSFLSQNNVDAVFLDVQMPGMNGFELLAQLPAQPIVIFTTAFDRYALDAFQFNSIDYLLKPIEVRQLERALSKLERLRGTPAAAEDAELIRTVARELCKKYPDRIASRVGERVAFINTTEVTHFYAKDKLTFAATAAKHYVVDGTVSELEHKLDPREFFRIHRSTLLNLKHVDEISSWFGGGMIVRLKDHKRTELPVARDRVRELKKRLDF
jgi:two-component system LytT family response regulator